MVIVTYFIRHPDTPQASVPFRNFRFFPGTGVCEKESKSFETMTQAHAWADGRKDIHRVRYHDTDNPERETTPFKRIRTRKPTPPGYWDKHRQENVLESIL